MSKTNNSGSNIFAFVLIAALVFLPGILNKGVSFDMNNLIPKSYSSFSMLDTEGRSVLSTALESMAQQIEDDGLRENKIVSRSSVLQAIERTLHNRIGTKVNIGQQYPGLGDELMSKVGHIPEFPQGRAYVVGRFRAIAGEMK